MSLIKSMPVMVSVAAISKTFGMLRLFFFFSSRRRHTRCSRDWSQTCALPILKRKAPANVVLSLAQEALGHGKKARVRIGIGADQIEAFVRALLPGFTLGRAQLRSGIVEAKDFFISLALTRHLFGARLAKANAVSGTAAGEQDFAAGIPNIVQVAANFVPPEHAIHREAQGRSGERNTCRISAGQVHGAHPSAGVAQTDCEL